MQQPETPKRDHQQNSLPTRTALWKGSLCSPVPSLVRELIMDHRGRSKPKDWRPYTIPSQPYWVCG